MNHPCTMREKTVRCECGGQIMVGASLHPLVDLGLGFRGNKFEVNRKYNMKKVIGYAGECMRCRKEGNFFLPGHMPPGS